MLFTDLEPIQEKLSPPLKWAGGKRWLVPHLHVLWAPHTWRRMLEPMCGGLAVTLGLTPANALLNDINPHLINFYQWLKVGLRPTLSMYNDETLYYAHRNTFNQLIRDGQQTSAEAAQLFYYLNRTGFNGLCRFNSKDEFNVPFGTYNTINYTTDFTPYKTRFAPWDFTCGPFEAIDRKPDDFIYADPPYDVEFTSYSKEGFTWDDQVRLAEWLAVHPGPVVLSNQATERIVRLYERFGFTLRYYQAPRRISCTGDRTSAREVLAMRNVL
ncbi:MAG: DNA adenine methylase [Aggregatilineales bacterium]